MNDHRDDSANFDESDTPMPGTPDAAQKAEAGPGVPPTGKTAGKTPGTTKLGFRSFLHEEARPYERYALFGGYGLLTLLVFTIVNGGPVHPVFPTAALVFFLYPFSQGIVTRRIIQLAIVTFLLWTFLNLSGVLFPFIVAFIFSYLCAPFANILAKRGIPRWVTSLAVVLLIIGVYSAIGFMIVPAFIGQFDQMLAAVQELFKNADVLNGDRMVAWLRDYGISKSQAEQIVADYVQPQLQKASVGLVDWLSNFLQNITTILEGLANVILIPFLSFYMTVDFNRFRRFVRVTLLRDDPRYVYYLQRVDTIVNAYIRGILLTSSIVGATAVGVLSAFGVPYAIVLGILTGVFNLIPTIGMFLNLGVAIIIFLFGPDHFWYNTLVMSITIFGLHAVNTNMIEPRIIGSRVGLHPVLLIASLFVFASYLGFVGLLIAVPTTAVVLMFLKEWYNHKLPTSLEPGEVELGAGSGTVPQQP